MSDHDNKDLEIEALSDDDLESVSGGATYTSSGQCNTSSGICRTSLGAICETSGSGSCYNQEDVASIDP